MEASNVSLEEIASQSNDITFIYDVWAKRFTYFSQPIDTMLPGVTQHQILQQPELLLELVDQPDREYVLSSLARIAEDVQTIDLAFGLFMPDQSR